MRKDEGPFGLGFNQGGKYVCNFWNAVFGGGAFDQ